MNRPEQVREHAQAYVDSVLEAQRKLGIEPHLSDEAYDSTVSKAAEGFAGLTDRQERPDEDTVPA